MNNRTPETVHLRSRSESKDGTVGNSCESKGDIASSLPAKAHCPNKLGEAEALLLRQRTEHPRVCAEALNAATPRCGVRLEGTEVARVHRESECACSLQCDKSLGVL